MKALLPHLAIALRTTARATDWRPTVPAAVGLFFTLALTLAFFPRTTTSPAVDSDPEPVVYRPNDLRPELDDVDSSIAPAPASHIVEDGDTLLGIALQFGASVESIRVASGLTDADLLRIGDVLTIPPFRSLLQEVDPFMTLRELGVAYSAPAEVVAAYNGRHVDLIDEPIQRPMAVLPPTVTEIPTRAVASARGGARNPAAPSAAGSATVYTVAEGDSILGIARKLGVPANALIAANRLANSDLIIAGDQLTLPVWSRPAEDVADVGIAAAAPREILVRAATIANDGNGTAAIERPRAPLVYEVAPGDTISTLAEQFGVDPDTIVFTNELSSADRIHIGDQLTILPVSGLPYTVRAGDTLADIAGAFKIDLGPIMDFNYLDDIDVLPVGKELILPGARPLPPPPRITFPLDYTVQAGDTVLAIAVRFGVDADDIIAANNLRAADRIGVGAVLRIVPGAAQAARTAQPPRANSQQSVTVNRPVPLPSAGTSTRQSTPGGGGGIVGNSMQFLGYKYVFGGTTPAGFDCSGFVYYVHNRSGKPISRGMWGQYGAGSHPSRANLQPGDIVFFQNTYMAGLSHNGIYVGNGQFIHASDERSGVKISSLSESYWASRWFGATRVW